jgi:hypothetical protein
MAYSLYRLSHFDLCQPLTLDIATMLEEKKNKKQIYAPHPRPFSADQG